MEQFHEKNLIINARELNYKGRLRVDELLEKINQLCKQRGYKQREKRNEEIVTEQGRKIYLELRPKKSKAHFAALIIKMRITIDNLTQEEYKQNEITKMLDNANVQIFFDGWVYTHYDHSWGMKAIPFFLKMVVNKYLYTFPFEASIPSELSSDVAYIYGEITKLLAKYKQAPNKTPFDAGVRNEIAKDIEREISQRQPWQKDHTSSPESPQP